MRYALLLYLVFSEAIFLELRMPNQFQKSLQAYISKIKKRKPENENRTRPNSFASSTSWILRGCKNPRTPSFRDMYVNPRQQNTDPDHVGEATLTDVDQFLQANFKSLFEDEDGENHFDLPDCSENHRFYIPPATFSSSLIEEAAGSSTGIISHQEHGDERGQLKSGDFIKVMMDSYDMYEDFRNSMQEMIEARVQRNGKINWDFMEDLLISYLNLNEKRSHRFILGAFVDIIAHLRDSEGGSNSNAPVKPNSVPSSSKGKEKI